MLFVTGVLDAKEMCSGFSAGTVVVTGVLAVVMAGLRYTGVLQWMMRHVFGLPDRYPVAHDIKNPTYKNWYMSPEAGKVVNK